MHDAATGNQLATELGSVYDCSEPWAETPDKEILAQKKKKKKWFVIEKREKVGETKKQWETR